VGALRRVLERADERRLHDVVRVRGAAGEAVAEAPQEALVLAELRRERVALGVADRAARGRAGSCALAAHAATASAGTARTQCSAARRALDRLASASMPSRPTQSPAT